MALSLLDKQTASCNSSHNCMTSLDMDHSALCNMWRWNDTKRHYLAAFSVDVALCVFVCMCLAMYNRQ